MQRPLPGRIVRPEAAPLDAELLSTCLLARFSVLRSRGNLLDTLRRQLGETPVVTTFDLHANMTALKVKSVTALGGYHTSPHTDLFDTGRKTGKILLPP